MAGRHWSKSEIKTIQKYYHLAPDYWTARFIPGRTICGVACKRRQLGLKYTQAWINQQLKINRISPYF